MSIKHMIRFSTSLVIGEIKGKNPQYTTRLKIKVWQYQVLSWGLTTREPSSLWSKVCALNLKKPQWASADVVSIPTVGPEPSQGLSGGFHVNCLTVGWSYLGREIAAEFELLQGQGHGVCPEEKDEGHECQVWDELAGIPK